MSYLYNLKTSRNVKSCCLGPLDFPSCLYCVLFLLVPTPLAPSARPPKGGSLMKQGSSWATQPLRPTDGGRVPGQGFTQCPVKAAGLQNTSRQDRDIIKPCTFHSWATERLLAERRWCTAPVKSYWQSSINSRSAWNRVIVQGLVRSTGLHK